MGSTRESFLVEVAFELGQEETLRWSAGKVERAGPGVGEPSKAGEESV